MVRHETVNFATGGSNPSIPAIRGFMSQVLKSGDKIKAKIDQRFTKNGHICEIIYISPVTQTVTLKNLNTNRLAEYKKGELEKYFDV